MWVCSLRNSVHNAFTTTHLFRDCFARNFKYRPTQHEWDILMVCIVRYSPDQGYSATICQHANQNAPRVPLCFICKTHHRLDFISIGRWKQCASWVFDKWSTRVPREHFGLRVDKSSLSTPGRVNNVLCEPWECPIHVGRAYIWSCERSNLEINVS